MFSLKDKRYLLLLGIYPFFGLLYLLAESRTGGYHLMTTALDYALPFVPPMVLFYLMWFPYVGLAVGFFALYSERDFKHLLFLIYTGMALSYVIYFLYPTAQNLRPNPLPDDIFSRVVAFLYRTDTPTNVAPSIHAIDAVAVHLAVSRSRLMKNRPAWRHASAFLSVGILLSTLLIKQHAIADVVSGTVLVFALDAFYRKKIEPKWRKAGSSDPT